MVSSKWSSCVVLLSLCLGWMACSKEDKKGDNLDDKLTNKYCNIPGAVNYNWGFPGKEDNSICFFATDYFVGTWTFYDTIILQDSTFIGTDSMQITFETIPGDTTYRKMNMLGWCGNDPILLDISKFYIGLSDTFRNSEGWQMTCNNTDSVKVELSKNILDTTIVNFHIRQYSNNELQFHNGTGKKN